MATLQELENGLRKAHAAGNTDHARIFANEIRRLRAEQPAADFSGVSSRVDSTAAGRLPDGSRPGLKRELGLVARNTMESIGGLVGAAGGDAVNYYAVPGDQPTYRDAASGLADRMGLPKPQSSQERVLADVGDALTGTAMTMGLGAGLNVGRSLAANPTVRTRAADLLTTQPIGQTVAAVGGSGASSVTRESGGGVGRQLTAGLAGGLVPATIGTTAAATTRGLIRGRSGETMRGNIADFKALGATPSVGQASGNRLVQGAENLLAGGPTSVGVMSRFAERQADDIGAGLQRTANNLSRNASAERAGRAIERGVDLFSGNTGATKKALYWQADQFIPASTPVPMANTWQEVVKLTTPNPGAAATTGGLIQPGISKLRQDLRQDLAAGGGSITYDALKRIRTDIGERIGGASPLNPPTDLTELRRLYAALSRDMEAAAQSQGPQAVQAAKRANNYTRAVADRLEQVQRVVQKNGGPEKVFQAAMSGTRDGGTTLRAVMQSLPPDGQKAVTAAVIKRMGMANPGAQDAAGDVFSAGTFLTNWNKVSPEAKRALFDRYGPNFSRNMDQIARVANNIKDGSKVFANPSGTANRAAAIGYGLTLGGSIIQTFLTGNALPPALAIGGGAGAHWLSRKLTNPDFVEWLAKTTTLPIGAAVSQFNALRNLGRQKNDQELIEIADALQGSQIPSESGNAPQQ